MWVRTAFRWVDGVTEGGTEGQGPGTDAGASGVKRSRRRPTSIRVRRAARRVAENRRGPGQIG